MLDGSAFGLVAALCLLARELLTLSALGVLVSGADDLFIDLVYFTRTTWRRLTVYNHHRRKNADVLRGRGDNGAMAVFVPAWDEAEVIGEMLANFTEHCEYSNYRVFVGVYPNDPATLGVVAALPDPRVSVVIAPRAGPTTKADCLNALWRAMVRHERQFGIRFKAIVLHDAEDVAHSLELRVFDHLIPAKAMVQLPVVPIRDPDSRWIAGHYLDEFAENHGKDLVVREALGAALPSAGVACAFERCILGKIAGDLDGAPFDPGSLTEDYELGLRIAARGGDAALVRLRGRRGGRHVATREHFPATLEAALRQKTRWLLGIALNGWDRVRWQGTLADRYMLLRDRKALFNALLIAFGYTSAAVYAAAFIASGLVAQPYSLPVIVGPGSALAGLLTATSALLLWRLSIRALFTGRQHGTAEALRSIPRAIVANIINFLAALRAVRRYIAILSRQETLRWEKTAHRFPSAIPAE